MSDFVMMSAMSPDTLNINQLPASLGPPIEDWLARHAAPVSVETLVSNDPALGGQLLRVLACSPYIGDCLGRYPQMLAELVESGRLGRPLAADELADVFADEFDTEATESEFQARLRRIRHRELVRIAWRDLTGQCGYDETLRELSALADASICHAHAWSIASLSERYGIARNVAGEPIGFAVLGMGKLGGRELNFSSDVDLVFVYSETGTTDGRKSVSAEEYFRLLGQRIVNTLSKNTADGFVYRVDVRLRPFGDSGPLAVNESALEDYLLQYGRDWERYAYIKSRVINSYDGAGSLYNDILKPFIYRRYIDYGVFSSLRDMKAMIDAEVERKEYRDNIKLGRGGIREIEFIVQSLQLVRGGTVAELRERRLTTALRELVRAECLPEPVADELEEAYEFLRLFENRLQAMNDRQTHDVPADDLSRARMTLAMGATSWELLIRQLEHYRVVVAGHFHNIVFRGGEEDDPDDGYAAALRAWTGGAGDESLEAAFGDLETDRAEEFIVVLRRFRDGGMIRRLDEPGLQRLNALLPVVIAVSLQQDEPLRALEGTLSVIEAIGRRSAYFALLNENPDALDHLVRLCGISDFLSRQLATHPLLLDELLDQRVFLSAPTRDEMQADLSARLSAAGGDQEQSHHALMNFQQAATFRVAVADLSDSLPLMRVSDRLTDIAELILQASLDLSWQELKDRHGRPQCRDKDGLREAQFAIVAYGKLGGLELGYGSDLDLVFLNDSEGEAQQTDGAKAIENSVFFARLARRIIHILTMATNSGSMYEVDMRLRPSGRSGMLVSSLGAFERYQRDDAWTWEHQALLRSRAVAGSESVCQAFDKLRALILVQYVRRDGLQKDVADMRGRMRDELLKSTPELFDLKQDVGGVTDIEFIVQYLVLREAANKPALFRYSDNIRQIESLVENGLLSSADGDALSDAYRSYRRRMHHLSLASLPNLVAREEVTQDAARVQAIWERVFG